MAISDWDVLAVDEMGRPCNGTADPSSCGIIVDVLENLIQIVGAELWKPQGLYTTPILGMVRHGDFTLLDVSIVTAPAPRDGVFWATWFVRGKSLAGIVGLVCLGFDEADQWTGILPEHVEALDAQVKAWGEEKKIPAALAGLGFGNALRFNQGDRYFSKGLGMALDATPPGEARTPVFYAWRDQKQPPLKPQELTSLVNQALVQTAKPLEKPSE